MRNAALAVVGMLVACSTKSTDTVDQVPRYTGTNLKVSMPPGNVFGQSTLKSVTGQDGLGSRLLLYIRAGGQVENGFVDINVALPFEIADVSRSANLVKIRRTSDLSFGDLVNRQAPVFRWTHRKLSAPLAEAGVAEVEPAGTLPEEPAPRPLDGDVFYDVGGPGWVAEAAVDLSQEQELSGSLTLVPRYAIDFGSSSVDLSKLYTVNLSGRASIGCLAETSFSSSEVGLENADCARLFAGFVGPLNP